MAPSMLLFLKHVLAMKGLRMIVECLKWNVIVECVKECLERSWQNNISIISKLPYR